MLGDWGVVWPFARKRVLLPKAPKEIRMTWKVVRIDGPICKEVGLKTQLGVVISSDAMLERTQTLLFCPLLTGDEKPQQMMPWHVPVTIEAMPNGEAPLFTDGVISTKVVLPVALDEVDVDQRDRSRLDRPSRQRAAACLKEWLSFPIEPTAPAVKP